MFCTASLLECFELNGCSTIDIHVNIAKYFPVSGISSRKGSTAETSRAIVDASVSLINSNESTSDGHHAPLAVGANHDDLVAPVELSEHAPFYYNPQTVRHSSDLDSKAGAASAASTANNEPVMTNLVPVSASNFSTAAQMASFDCSSSYLLGAPAAFW